MNGAEKEAGGDLSGNGAPNLVGRRCELRAVVPSDYGFLYALSNTGDVPIYWRHRGLSISPEHFAASLWQTVLVQHLVVHRKTRSSLGLMVAYEADMRNSTTRLAMLLEPRAHRSGWAMEGGALFVDFLFRTWPFRKVYFEVLTPILRRIERGIGRLVVEEGRLRHHEYVSGTWTDLHILALYREHWEGLRPRIFGVQP